MGRNEMSFAVVVKNGDAVEIGRSYIEHPPIRYDGRKTKWFDDVKLLKKGGAS